MRTLKQKGFTIIELLIVIVVIGILATLVLNTFRGVQARARDTERKADLNALGTQLEVYYTDHGYYPGGTDNSTTPSQSITADADVVVTLPGIDAGAVNDPNGNIVNVTTDASTVDPGTNEYYYRPDGCTSGECTSFTLYTYLEDTNAATPVVVETSLNQ